MNPQNSIQMVRSAINVFLLIAVAISLFQEIDFGSSSTSQQPQQPVPQIPENGTKVDGLVILTTDRFRKDFKDLLIEKEYNIDIKEYVFEGEQYWINLFLTHGHILIVFLLFNRYQSEQDAGKKTKLMMIGMVLVFGWMMGAPYLKTHKLALEYRGQKIYQKDSFIHNEILQKLQEFDEMATFDLDPHIPPVSSQSTTQQVQFEEQQIIVDF